MVGSGFPAWGKVILTSTPLTHTNSQQAPWWVWWAQFTGAACAAGTAETNSEMAIDTTATAMERIIKRGMVSGSLSFSELVVMGQRAFVQERALAKWACRSVAPTVKDQRYIPPGLACACGRYLSDPSAWSQQRPSPRTNYKPDH